MQTHVEKALHWASIAADSELIYVVERLRQLLVEAGTDDERDALRAAYQVAHERLHRRPPGWLGATASTRKI